ncbi:Protein IN CHLOROPLAST ATPASE BIOGENESIS, chloroplastic, partial [Cucurbita argyrosperma subsp. sororia]
MKIGGGVVCGSPRAAVLPSLLLGRRGVTIRCSSSSSTSDHVSFIKDVAATEPPQHLSNLLKMLKTRDIFLSTRESPVYDISIYSLFLFQGTITALLRWPTAPAGMEMPVVDVNRNGVWLLAKNVDQFIHRLIVEEDAKGSGELNDELFLAAADAGQKLYERGDFAESQIKNIDGYLLKKVGIFPDIIERKILRHFEEGDLVSALVTGEFYTKKEHFPGFARPYVFNAEVLLKVGRKTEAKDAARGALKSPWWTLGCKYEEVANIAQWEDEQIEYLKEKVTEEGKLEDLKKGKAPAQVALDQAAFLLDLASVDGTWDISVERIAQCYEEAGLQEIARFVLYRD